MTKSIASRSLIVAALLCFVSMLAHASGKGGIRIICEGEIRNAEVTVNGKSYGSCPADIETPAGQVDLKITKQFSDGVVRFYQEIFSLGNGALRRVEVVPHLMRPLVSHTKEETIEWLTRKLTDQLNGGFLHAGSRTAFRVSVENDILVIERTTNPNNPSASYIFRVPLRLINHSEVYFAPSVNYFVLAVRFPKNCSECTVYSAGQDYGDATRQYGEYTFQVKNSEPGLNERFNDAFQHLKSFREQPRPKTTEKF